MAPERFLEILTNELRMAAREDRLITLISIRLIDHHNSDHQPNEQIEEQELLLTRLASAIQSQLRAGDHCARISETGFWILIRGDGDSARKAAPRLIGQSGLGVGDEALLRVELCESEAGESVKNLLRRMDAIHFTR
jgi:GGDEF domain-containing protein